MTETQSYDGMQSRLRSRKRWGLALHLRPGATTRIPLLAPEPVPVTSNGRYQQPRTYLSPESWPQIQARHRAWDSLRTLAKANGVSHEAIRQIVRCAESLAAD
jgi:hypothetical protein